MEIKTFTNCQFLDDGEVQIGNGILLSQASFSKKGILEINIWEGILGLPFKENIKTNSKFPVFDENCEKNYLTFKVKNGKVIAKFRRSDKDYLREKVKFFPLLNMLFVRDRIYGHKGYLLIGEGRLFYIYCMLENVAQGLIRSEYYNLDIKPENIDTLFEVIQPSAESNVNYSFNISLEQLIAYERKRCKEFKRSRQ